MITLVVDNIGALATMDGAGIGAVEGTAAVLVEDERIVWAGPRARIPSGLSTSGARYVDAGGRAVVPGLIDCHTHLCFIGDRADEFARRARGETYAQIMAAGGGIRSSVAKVRAASVDDLVRETGARLATMLARGVTTVEIKSGYGLDVDSELKMLHAIGALASSSPPSSSSSSPSVQPVTVVPTLLAAHAVPPEYEGRASAYIDDVVIRELLPIVAREKLASTCDVFVENGAFSVDDGRRLLRAARDKHGLGVRVHAEQLSRQGGAQLAAELGAVSAGHLEHVDAADIAALAKAGVVCEVLSTAQIFLRGQRAIPGRALADAGCTVAVATDCNPGTAMSTDLALAAGFAVTQCGLTVEEALRGITVNAARALGLTDRGVIAAGKRADILVLDATSPFDLVYRWGESHAHTVVAGGRVVHRRSPAP